MPKIFRTPSGQSDIAGKIGELTRSIFSGGVDPVTAERTYDLQRRNVETDNLMRRVAEKGAQLLGNDPTVQAIMIGSGFNPADFAKIGLMGAATGFGAEDPRTANWQVGSGQSYSSTAPAFNKTLAETARANDMASADRRYVVDQNKALELYKFGNLSADQAADNAETVRNNDLASADRRYGVDREYDLGVVKDGTERRGQDLASADRRYQTDQSQGTERWKSSSEPMPALVDGQPGYVPRGSIVESGAAPILSESDQKGTLLGKHWDDLASLSPPQQKALGANVDATARTPRNYVVGNRSFITYDGVTDAQSGMPLPPGGFIGNVEGGAGDVGLMKPVAGAMQEGIIANNRLSNLLREVRTVAERDPTNFGIPGFIKGTAQDVSQIAQGLAVGLGYQGAEELVTSAMQGAAARGIDPNLLSGVFNPDLSSLQTLNDLIVYAAAEALAGQSGRDMSNRDVEVFRQIVGDPRDWLMSQQKYLAKLTQIERILGMNQGEFSRALSEGAVDRTGAPPASAPAESTVQPGPADAIQQARDAIARGANRDAVIERLRQMGVSAEGL